MDLHWEDGFTISTGMEDGLLHLENSPGESEFPVSTAELVPDELPAQKKRQRKMEREHGTLG